MNTEPLVLTDHPFAGCALLTLNRPQAKNALSLALRRELVHAVRATQQDAHTQVLVLTGAGSAFCAGLDLKELASAPDGRAAITPQADDDPVRALRECACPIIGAINGPAITGGFELALACDLLIASSEARFADTHARVGVLPAWGLSQSLPRLIGIARAKELSFTGNFLNAEQAQAWGLVNRVVSADALIPATLALARDIAAGDAATVRAYKRLIDDGFTMSAGEALRMERERAYEWAKAVDFDSMEQRRQQVTKRGRGQSRGRQRL